MSQDIPPGLWKMTTTTVGLVTTRLDDGVNIMAAEWSYFVNKNPLYVAVVLNPNAITRGLLAEQEEFSVTMCSEDQSEIADFAGSFHGDVLTKAGSDLFELGEPDVIGTPWVRGGLVSLECRLRETVELPVHRMFIGEAVAAHVPESSSARPLVKHGGMFALGEPLRRQAVVAAAEITADRTLLVVATGPAADEDVWRLSLTTQSGQTVDLGEHPSAEYGDFAAELPLPDGVAPGDMISVERAGAKTGTARVTAR